MTMMIQVKSAMHQWSLMDARKIEAVKMTNELGDDTKYAYGDFTFIIQHVIPWTV